MKISQKAMAAAAAGMTSLAAKSARASGRYLPSDPHNIRVGWVGTGPFSFYGRYVWEINASEKYNPLAMRVTHIWGDDYAKNYKGSTEWVAKMLEFWASDIQSPQGIAAKFGIPNVCHDFREMADDVDAAMIMDFDRAYELAEPFLTRGKPVFLCSPVAVSVPECERILDLAEANNAAVVSGSFTFGMPENQIRNARINRDNIAAFFASTSHHFYTSYANDGLEPVHWLIGGKARRVQLVGWHGSKGYDPDRIPVSRIHLEYEPVKDNPPVQGALTLGGFKRETEWYRVYYRDNTVFEGSTYSSNYTLNFRDFLLAVQETFATNVSTETREDILQKLRVIIGAYKSANEGNRPVNLDDIGGYRLPTVRIEKWNEIPE